VVLHRGVLAENAPRNENAMLIHHYAFFKWKDHDTGLRKVHTWLLSNFRYRFFSSHSIHPTLIIDQLPYWRCAASK
jgi:hypothetical protein